MSLKKRVESGVSWNVIGQIGNQVVNILLTMILARLLSPADFGTIAMITVFTGFTGILINFGFGNAIIQKKNISETDLSSIFWLNIGIGSLLTCLLLIAAPFIADFYSTPKLKNITIFISFSYFLSSINVVQNALFSRNFQFKILVIRQLLATFLAGIIGVYFAYTGWGAWSLAIKSFLTVFFSTCFIWLISKWRPKFIFHFSAVKSVMKLSSSLFFNSSLNYIAANIDNLLIGRVLGQSPLGLYSKSYNIISLPVSNVTSVITKVMMPSFSLIQTDKQRIRDIYLKMNNFVLMITAPFMLIVLINAKNFTLLLFGENWLGIVPFIKFFAISGILASLNSLLGSVVISQNRSDIIFKDALYKKVLIIGAIIVGINFGLIGVVVAKVTADVICLGITFYHCKKAINLSIQVQIKNLARIVVFNLVTATLSYIMLPFIKTYLEGSLLVFITSTLIYLSVYGSILILAKNEEFHYLLNFIKNKVGYDRS